MNWSSNSRPPSNPQQTPDSTSEKASVRTRLFKFNKSRKFPFNKSPPAYINKLLPELLGDIATLLASVEPQSIWKFASVCRYWRISALSTPEAWSHLYIELQSNDKEYFTEPKMANMQLWLERAKACKLVVAFDIFKPAHALINTDISAWSRIRRLHLGSVPDDFDAVLSSAGATFNALEALSIRYFINWSMNREVRPTFTRIVNAFLRRVEGEGIAYSGPYLSQLSLDGVDIDSEAAASFASFPQLAQLRSLKLIHSFTEGSSIADLLIRASSNLTNLYLDLRGRVSHLPPEHAIFGVMLENGGKYNKQSVIEFPHVKEMTVRIDDHNWFSQDLLTRLRCPSLTRLTCDDHLARQDSPYQTKFPKLVHLFVNSKSSFGTSYVQDWLPALSPGLSTLTFLYPRIHGDYGTNPFIWKMAENKSLGVGLTALRFVTPSRDYFSEGVLRPLNRSRRKDQAQGDFIKVLEIPRGISVLKPGTWDTELWWNRDIIWQ